MMRLPLPNLDDRLWTDLVEEGRNLIPRYAPEWTDFNVHDPGITLIELFAWIAEMDVYRLNRIPESHRRKFLRLLGIVPRPPLPAKTVVQFSPRGGTSPIELPATIEVETQNSGGTIRFRTLEALTVVSAQLRELWRQDQNGIHDLTALWENQEQLPMFGNIPQTGSVFYFGSSDPFPPGRTVTLYLRFASDKSVAEERQRVQEELIAAKEDCAPPSNCCQPKGLSPAGEAPKILPHHSVRTVWEFAQKSVDAISWRTLDPEKEEVVDQTRALTLNGFVRFKLPSPMSGVALTPSGNRLYYLRCRYVSGEYDAPPALLAAYLNATTVEQAVPVSAEFAIAANAIITYPPESPPSSFGKFTLRFNSAGEIAELNFLGSESDAPEFLVTRLDPPIGSKPGVFGCELQHLDQGLGEPSQEVVLEPAPVQSHSVDIFTLEDEVWQVWRRRCDFDATSRNDRHFLLDETTGTVTFGDGEKGLPAPKGSLIIARFRATRAEQGNILAGKISRLSDSAHNQALIDVSMMRSRFEAISNPFPATGGAEAEPLTRAEGRALEEVNCVTRAVTISDVEYLALSTPGANIARVAGKPNLDARYPCLHAPGVITVIILPNLDKPGVQPSTGLLAAVRSYLNRRRIIGSRIEVLGPVYTKVTVMARVQSQIGADTTRVQRDILQALRDFFDPLHGGPEKTGWPFGRDVYRSEVLHTIDSIPGVENVISLELIANDGETTCGNLCIGPCGLVLSGEHEIVVV